MDTYNSMIDSVDDVDRLADLRIRESSNDIDLKAAIEKSIIKYNDFLNVINEVVEFIPEPKAVELTPPIVSW